jgi:hypothetical protein
MYTFLQGTPPPPRSQFSLYEMKQHTNTHDTRNRQNPHVVQRRISITSKSLHHKGPAIWYLIPKEITSKNIKSFSNIFKKVFINNY